MGESKKPSINWKKILLYAGGVLGVCATYYAISDLGRHKKLLETKPKDKHEVVSGGYRSWSEIVSSDTLRVGTMTSPLDFFIYRGQEFGLEYQKILSFAKKNNLEIDVHLTTTEDSLRLWLNEGLIDLSITPFAMTKTNTDEFRFCGMVDTVALFLVQKKVDKIHLVTSEHLSALNGQDVYVVENTVEHLRIQQIKDESGLDDLNIIPVDTVGIEDLIAQVSTEDSIKYTIADRRLAQLFAHHYDNIDAGTKISVPLKYSWVTHSGSDSLAIKIDEYFSDKDIQNHFNSLLKQDLTSSKFFMDESNNHIVYKLKNGGISPYDDLFRQEAKRLGWSWTYLAAIAFQESRFDSNVVGWSGARGLMGIMPKTGRSFGASEEELLNPRVSVRVSVDCLMEYSKPFKKLANNEETMHFTLASYNAGLGHIMDAIRLAEKYGAPTDVWHGGVREYLLLKSTPKYYNDPVVKNGYVRGSETVKYVDQIMERGRAYAALTKKK